VERGFDIVNRIGYILKLGGWFCWWCGWLVCGGCVMRLIARNGMFGKRGEIPPLPRNCERARWFFFSRFG
jgi:hypothetical protein